MKNIKNILDEVLEEIQPDKEYEKEIFIRIKDIIRKIGRHNKNIKANLGGSGAKGTWLKTFDADIFVLFDYGKFNGKSSELSDILERILKKDFKIVKRLHGSRDYFQLRQGRFTFEIIPILKISKSPQAMNITDVSPLHFRWVSKHKKLVNDMKLAKQFCKAQSIYGAESYIRGFSGYICEILVVHYGSFYNLMKNAAKWPDKVVIDAEKHFKGMDIFKTVNTSKLISPLIVIDPVQKDRNAAAALSQEKFDAFKQAAKDFVAHPSKGFFSKKDMKKQFLDEKTKGRKLMTIEIVPLAGKRDVVGSKLMKIFEFLAKKLEEFGFKAIRREWEWENEKQACIYFLFEDRPLQDKIEIEGPPIKMKEHTINFKKKHKKTFTKSGKICAIEDREFTVPEKAIANLLNDGFVKEKCRSIVLRFL